MFWDLFSFDLKVPLLSMGDETQLCYAHILQIYWFYTPKHSPIHKYIHQTRHILDDKILFIVSIFLCFSGKREMFTTVVIGSIYFSSQWACIQYSYSYITLSKNFNLYSAHTIYNKRNFVGLTWKTNTFY